MTMSGTEVSGFAAKVTALKWRWRPPASYPHRMRRASLLRRHLDHEEDR